jgi:hypothetical protein
VFLLVSQLAKTFTCDARLERIVEFHLTAPGLPDLAEAAFEIFVVTLLFHRA